MASHRVRNTDCRRRLADILVVSLQALHEAGKLRVMPTVTRTSEFFPL